MAGSVLALRDYARREHDPTTRTLLATLALVAAACGGDDSNGDKPEASPTTTALRLA